MGEVKVEFRYSAHFSVFRNGSKVAKIPEPIYTVWRREYWSLPGDCPIASWAEYIFYKLNQKENSHFRSTGYEEGRHG